MVEKKKIEKGKDNKREKGGDAKRREIKKGVETNRERKGC